MQPIPPKQVVIRNAVFNVTIRSVRPSAAFRAPILYVRPPHAMIATAPARALASFKLKSVDSSHMQRVQSATWGVAAEIAKIKQGAPARAKQVAMHNPAP